MIGPRSLESKSWLISGGTHLVIALMMAWVIWNPAKKTENLEITVLEAPLHAPVIRMRAPEKKEAQKTVPRAVFGLSRKAITSSEPAQSNEPALKQGNTLTQAPDQETLRPEDADQLPIPSEDYLITRMPTLAREIRIPYPPEAKQKGVQGAVVMDLLIDSTGKVREAKLVQGPDPSLIQAALAAVRDFIFQPALIQDKTVAVRIRYAYRFILSR